MIKRFLRKKTKLHGAYYTRNRNMARKVKDQRLMLLQKLNSEKQLRVAKRNSERRRKNNGIKESENKKVWTGRRYVESDRDRIGRERSI